MEFRIVIREVKIGANINEYKSLNFVRIQLIMIQNNFQNPASQV